MTWQAIARKDFRDAVRSRWLWGLSAVFFGLFVGSAYLIGSGVEPQGNQPLTSEVFVPTLGNRVVALVVPIVAIAVAYSSIIGERESGSLKLLLSLPHSRQDVVAGKTLGRSTVLTLPVLIAMLLAAVVLALYGVQVEPLKYFAFVALTLLLGVVFVSVAVGFSAASSSNRRAMLGTVGTYVVLTMLWTQVRRVLVVFNDQLGLGWENMTLVKYGLFIKFFNPIRAYESLVTRLYTDSVLSARLYGAGRMQSFIAKQIGETPVYLSDWVVLAQFLLWLLVPVALGYLAFNDSDL
ncbi:MULTISPECIES: ABC transporter permease subunit [Halorussus]|uniref:ABC transporter permease subunit n=1 Tax=Halorussus TaxID=1070314 RepID=UPI000E20EF7A|nr:MULTISPECIES: ABC transporter permease subunit [Halorussus]NHN60949.1 ABC transporter permease [Halorussus sp. JP-T4]